MLAFQRAVTCNKRIPQMIQGGFAKARRVFDNNGRARAILEEHRAILLRGNAKPQRVPGNVGQGVPLQVVAEAANVEHVACGEGDGADIVKLNAAYLADFHISFLAPILVGHTERKGTATHVATL